MSTTPAKKILIFGSGLLSRYIAAAALDDGIEPVVLYNKHSLEELDNVEQICFSSRDMASLLTDIRPSYIVSLQGNSFVPDNKHLIESLNTNLMVTLSFMEQVMTLVQQGIIMPEKIVLVGSAGEYGKSYLVPITESFPLNPTSIYGLTKIFLYNTAKYYIEKGLPIIYTRQFNTTGPYQRADFVVPSICRQISLIEKGQLESLTIGDTTQERDFIDVRDAARAYLSILKQGVVGEIYNIGSGQAVAIAQVLDKAVSFACSGTKITTTVNKQLFFDKNALSNRICANVSKLAELDFKPRFTLDDTLKDTLDFWRERV
jgi:GDP-4-dehydro-6-deoxy-D-mannose reductase